MPRTIEVDGVIHEFPDDATDQEIQEALGGGPTSGLSEVAGAPSTIQMQESWAPGIAKVPIESLPAIGGIGGAIAGAPAAGWGGVAGGALGAAGGEVARQWLMNRIFGEGSAASPTSKQGLTQTAAAGAIGAISEVPGALVNRLGAKTLQGIERSVPAKQTGNAMQALEESPPLAASAKGIQQDLTKTQQLWRQKLTEALTRSKGTIDINTLLANARAQAAQAPIPGALQKLNTIIEAAKFNAGVQGEQLTARQLVALQKELSNPAYAGNPGPVAKVLRNLMQNAYGSMGQGVRQLAPGAAQPLAKLTDIYAAQAGVKAFNPGTIQALAMNAALRPRTTAVISPLLTAMAAAGSKKAREAVQETAAGALAP